MSLVNVSLKYQMLISDSRQYFLLKKCEKLLQCSAKASLIFSTKNISVFKNKVIQHLTSWPLNELVKLTMFWTTGSRSPEKQTRLKGYELWRRKDDRDFEISVRPNNTTDNRRKTEPLVKTQFGKQRTRYTSTKPSCMNSFISVYIRAFTE